jgi:hypothetical protein
MFFSKPCKGNESTAYYQIYQLTISKAIKVADLYVNVTAFYKYATAFYINVTDFYNF